MSRILIRLCVVSMLICLVFAVNYEVLIVAASESSNATNNVKIVDVTVSDPNGTNLYTVRGVDIPCVQTAEGGCVTPEDGLCREFGLGC